jgi:hypothetical protein
MTSYQYQMLQFYGRFMADHCKIYFISPDGHVIIKEEAKKSGDIVRELLGDTLSGFDN